MAVSAVELLRQRGYRARRLVESVPSWRALGYPIDHDPPSAASTSNP
jgi:hypothetical protein